MSAVLDEAAELVARQAPGWAGLLALTALPLRFLEAHFLARLFQLGEQAPRYVSHLLSLSTLLAFALLLALWGRAVFARACSLALAGRGAPAARTGLRLPLPALASYAYAGAFAELALVALGWTVLALPVLALYAGLAAATAPFQERPGPLRSLLAPVAAASPPAPFLGLVTVFTLALPVVFLNLYFLFTLGLWLAGGAAGSGVAWWQAAFSWENPQYLLLLLAGAVTVLEPFWIASLVTAVRQARARESGEDLAAWFAEVRSRSAEEAA